MTTLSGIYLTIIADGPLWGISTLFSLRLEASAVDILDIVFQRFSSTPPISINGFFPALRPFLPISELDKKFIRLLDFMREHIKGAILKLDIVDRPPLLSGFHATYE